ncbi:MAG: ABC transporter ATP-binding protein [Trueperaceae bacterium]
MPAVEGAAHVELTGLHKAFGATTAVADFSLSVPRGSFTTLLGPSGCGKTTVLRIVAGFVEPDAGSVVIAGVDQVGRPPNLRGVGLVFQDYALFPHMNVRANVGYGLRMRRMGKAERVERVQRALELLGLDALGRRFPHELSGGQQQRVALGRVIVLEPEVLLMDEPLSNLDAKLRLRLRAELKELQRQLGITTIYVTHDQEEALSLSDQVVVMDHGRGQQVGAPEAVYQRPTNRFVAEFVGQANLLPVQAVSTTTNGSVTATAVGQPLVVCLPDERQPATGSAGLAMVRPEHVLVGPADTFAAPGAWQVKAKVVSSGFYGAFQRYWLALEGVPEPWLVDLPLDLAEYVASGSTAPTWQPGAAVAVGLRPGGACWLW